MRQHGQQDGREERRCRLDFRRLGGFVTWKTYGYRLNSFSRAVHNLGLFYTVFINHTYLFLVERRRTTDRDVSILSQALLAREYTGII
jgi:hypothetical protein